MCNSRLCIFSRSGPGCHKSRRSKQSESAMLSRFLHGISFAFFALPNMNPTGSSESSQSLPETATPIVFQCPRCRTTLKLDRALAGTTANCESCQNLIRVPRPRSPKKILSKAELAAQEPIEELERRLQENESQRTEI